MMPWEHWQIVPMWTEIWWRAEKEKVEMATGRRWTSFEWSQETWHAREYFLSGYWQIFVDDRLVPQPKAVFSCAMTVMVKICGW